MQESFTKNHKEECMRDELITIHNYLMQIEVKGESVIHLAESIVRIRQVIREVETPIDESSTTELS